MAAHLFSGHDCCKQHPQQQLAVTEPYLPDDANACIRPLAYLPPENKRNASPCVCMCMCMCVQELREIMMRLDTHFDLGLFPRYVRCGRWMDQQLWVQMQMRVRVLARAPSLPP